MLTCKTEAQKNLRNKDLKKFAFYTFGLKYCHHLCMTC